MIRGAAGIVCSFRFNVSFEISEIFHNGSNYGYHFTIKELANKFEGQFECSQEKQKSENFFCFNKKRKYKNW